MEEKPFGPTIVGMKMPEDMIDELNADCEFVTRPENFHRFDYSKELIGQIKLQARMNELRLSPDIMPWFISPNISMQIYLWTYKTLGTIVLWIIQNTIHIMYIRQV